MVSPIYRIQNRGQVVNNACQWLWEHRRLAFRIMLAPTLLGAGLLAFNVLFLDFWVVYVLLFLYVVLLLPVLPCLMFHVVEHPEESGYPDRMPRLKEVLKPWWRCFLQMLIITIVFLFAMGVLSITVIGPMLAYFLYPLAVVIAQRDEEAGISAIPKSISMVKNSFGNFCMVILGCWIIVMSLMLSPFIMVEGIGAFLRSFMTRSLMESANSLFNRDVFSAIGIFMMILGGVFSSMIVTVVFHFFYGHCKEKEEHPALIEKIENFDDK